MGVVNLASEQEEGEGSPWGCGVGAEQRARDHRGLLGAAARTWGHGEAPR